MPKTKSDLEKRLNAAKDQARRLEAVLVGSGASEESLRKLKTCKREDFFSCSEKVIADIARHFAGMAPESKT